MQGLVRGELVCIVHGRVVDVLFFAEFFNPIGGIGASSRGDDCDVFCSLMLGVWGIFRALDNQVQFQRAQLVERGCVGCFLFSLVANNETRKKIELILQGRLIILCQIFDQALHVLADLFLSLLKGKRREHCEE